MKYFNRLLQGIKISFFRDMKIRTRLVLSVSIFSIIGICIILAIVGLITARSAEKNAGEIAGETADTYNNIIKLIIEEPLYEARLLAHFIETTKKKLVMHASREDVNDLLKSFVEKSKYGIAYYIRFEPDAFDGLDQQYANIAGYDSTGRFSSYWVRDKNGNGVRMPLPDYQTVGIEDSYQRPKKRMNEYYELPKKRLNECILEPYTNPVFGKNKPLISVVVPIFDFNLRFRGIAGVDISLDHLQNVIENFKVGHFKGAYVNFYSQGGIVIGSKYLDTLGKNISDISNDKEFVNMILVNEDFFIKKTLDITGKEVFIYGSAVQIGKTETSWTVTVNIPEEEIFSEVDRLVTLVLTIGLLSTFLIICGVWFISGAIALPINKLNKIFQIVAGGNLDFDEPIDVTRKDELGSLAKSFVFMKDEIRKQIFMLKESENALKESEYRLRSIGDNLPGGMIYQLVMRPDRTRYFTYVSAGVEKIHDLTKEQVLADASLPYGNIHRDDIEYLLSEEDRVMKNFEIFNVIIRLLKKSGEIRWHHIVSQPRLLSNGDIAADGIELDITEQKIAELELQKIHHELEQRVLDRTEQLEAANKELESFSYSVSHDLRAPLRAIDGYARMVEEDYHDKIDSEGRRILGVVRSEALRMGQLIDDLLRFSRLSRQPLTKFIIDMTELVREVYDQLKNEVQNLSVDLRLTQLPQIKAELPLIRQVWNNLLHNAIKFSKGRKDIVIEVGGSIQGGEAVYFVKDNGVGFDMRYADKLFGVFQRLHSQSEFDGTGVGLALVQRIIHRHGGRVWADSEVDKGATFSFSLPLKEGGK